MQSTHKPSLLLVIAGIIAAAVLAGGMYYAATQSKDVHLVPPTEPTPQLTTYDNFGISFQYPSEWGFADESMYDNGLATISFGLDATSPVRFTAYMTQDTNSQGTGLVDETFDQMIARFRTNNSNAFDVKDIVADGVRGKELFYTSAVTHEPYHVEAYFPFQQKGRYISLSADYESTPLSMFDSVISSIKWNSATAIQRDSRTGMGIYRNKGITFLYPQKFNTEYASLTVTTTMKKTDPNNVDFNGCHTTTTPSGRTVAATVATINGLKFCTTMESDVGAGQLYTVYDYVTVRDDNAYAVEYIVHTPNGCGAYQNSENLTAPENAKYNECMDFKQNKYDNVVVKAIQDSIATFRFVN